VDVIAANISSEDGRIMDIFKVKMHGKKVKLC
jgi:hypothetical protein